MSVMGIYRQYPQLYVRPAGAHSHSPTLAHYGLIVIVEVSDRLNIDDYDGFDGRAMEESPVIVIALRRPGRVCRGDLSLVTKLY
jgi:hypothetical protein